MSITAALGLYFVIWWVVWFAVLPWGVTSQHEGKNFEPGTDPGAPERPYILRKVIVTSAVSAVILAAVYVVWTSGIIPFDRIPMPYDSPNR
jgi:predicted secreted protein